MVAGMTARGTFIALPWIGRTPTRWLGSIQYRIVRSALDRPPMRYSSGWPRHSRMDQAIRRRWSTCWPRSVIPV
jgi:hypothetical protein